MTAFAGWQNFYVIVGSSAGALIGLQFVVITLIAERPALLTAEASAAFATPRVVHFGVVLLLSAILNVPWNGITIVAVLWGLVSLCGIVYAVIETGRLRVQTAYELVIEDWLFHSWRAHICEGRYLGLQRRRCCCFIYFWKTVKVCLGAGGDAGT